MKNFSSWILPLLTALVMVFALLLYITPEKTKNKEFTNFFKYWTSDTYFMQNFKK